MIGHNFDGDVSVGRNISLGGKLTSQGGAEFKGNVNIAGWLDAKNIKGTNKGLFVSEEELIKCYPEPLNGWFALVSDTSDVTKAFIFSASDGAWRILKNKANVFEFIVDSVNMFPLRSEVKDIIEHFHKIEWGDTDNVNDFLTAGVYNITGIHSRGNDNLPISVGENATFNATLTVLDSSLANTKQASDDVCITQILSISDRDKGEGDVYIRTGRGYNKGYVEFSKWGKLQTNVEVGWIDSYDSLIDNGMYSGVYYGPESSGLVGDMFILITLNNYAVAETPELRCVSQFIYSLSLNSNVSLRKRVGRGFNVVWDDWKPIASGGSAAIEAQTPLAQKNGKLSLNIGDGLKVEDEKLVLDDFVREGAVAEYDEENKRLEFKGLGDTSTAVNSAKSLALREFFVAAGAEYNDTGVDIIKTTPWAAYVDNEDILNISASDVKTIVQGGTTYKYVIDNGVYKVVLTDLLGNIRHNEQYCIHRAGHYYLNGLGDITEEQMLTIYNNKAAFDIILAGLEVSTRLLQDIATAPRTLLPPTGSLRRFDNKKIGGYYMVAAGVEVVDFAGGNWATIYIPDINAGDPVFYNCNKLVAISPFKISKAMNLFLNCPNLRYVAIKSNNSLNFKSSPYISKKSILYAINNSTATTAITITLHANAYARLANDTDIVAALANKPLVTLVSA